VLVLRPVDPRLVLPERRREFEGLLDGVARRCGGATRQAVDGIVTDALGRLGDLLHASRTRFALVDHPSETTRSRLHGTHPKSAQFRLARRPQSSSICTRWATQSTMGFATPKTLHSSRADRRRFEVWASTRSWWCRSRPTVSFLPCSPWTGRPRLTSVGTTRSVHMCRPSGRSSPRRCNGPGPRRSSTTVRCMTRSPDSRTGVS